MGDVEQYCTELEGEIAGYRRNLASLERDKKRLPFLLLLVPLAIPAAFLFNWVVVLALVAMGIIIPLSGMYLVSGHRSEYLDKITDLEKEIDRVRVKAKRS